MANGHHILLLITILTLLFPSQSQKNLIVESINNKKAKLIFKIDEDDFQSSAIEQPKNSAGYPLYTFILTVDRNSIIEFDYTIKKMTDINYSIQSQIFVDGISKNERHYTDNQPVFVSKELIRNDTKYILLSISPVKDNMLYTEIDIDIISEKLISPDQFEIININDASKILSRNTELESTPVLLIIAPDGDNIYNLMIPFLNWKKQKGYKVFYYTLSEVGYTSTEIKAFIQSAYNNWDDRPNYICLIGDADGPYSVPTFNESLSTYNGEGDHPYTLLDGNDNISDVAIGRFSIRSLSDLATISNKIINYEQNPYIGETNWFKRALCVGDPSVSGMSTIITNQIIAELMISNDYNEVLEVYQYPFVTQIENGINSGVSFYNYRGFAGSSGWQKDEADDLNNGYMLPIVSVITCDTGSFLEDEESTSENFLRAGSISIPKGGIAAIGMATQGTHTMFNNCLDYGLYHGIFVENISTLGDVVNYAKNNLWLNYPENPNNYVEIFSHWINLMGDPTLSIWTDTPKNFESSFNSTVPLGQQFLDIEVTSNNNLIDNALVTITDQDYNLISSSLTDAGIISLPISLATIGLYNVTITKQNYMPLVSQFEIEQAEHSIMLSQFGILNQNISSNINPNDQIEMNFTVFNYGYNDLSNLHGELTINDPDVIINNNTFIIDTIILSNQESEIITINGNINSDVFKKEITGTIYFYSDNQTWEIPISFIINGTDIVSEFSNLAEQDFLSVGHNDLTLQLLNIGHNSNPMELQITSSSELVTINNSIINIPEILTNEIFEPEQMIEIQISDSAYPGLQIPIILSYYINDVNPIKSDTKILTLGQINSHAPLGPDQYGYYIYDNSDVIYEDAPNYDWIEIDPILSGSGTILINLDDNGDNQDDVTFINTPFDFQFYGETYEQISISTNGWVKPGLTNQSSFRNWRIPGAGGPSPMIAAFWDDLRTDNGRICVDYDVENHWYIIEWSSVRNGFDFSEETFQIIIYDENYYPTITGDNIIKVQYKVFNNVNTGHYDPFNQWHGNYASIGIENHEANMGLEYTWNNQYPTSAYELKNESAILITTNIPEFSYSQLGDVNFDQSVDVLDIVTIIQFIINDYDSLEIIIAGDVNFDENLNVLDVVSLINTILGS